MTSSDERRLREYEICRVRGHQPSGRRLLSNPPYDVCEWCGTGFRYEQTLVEVNAPKTETKEG